MSVIPYESSRYHLGIEIGCESLVLTIRLRLQWHRQTVTRHRRPRTVDNIGRQCDHSASDLYRHIWAGPMRVTVKDMAPKYKLTYFQIRVIAEPIRYILAYAGADYEDIRIERTDWPQLKPDTPYGTLPVLEVDGKKLGQSVPICRYLAKQHGLLAENDWDNAQIDAAVDAINDLRLCIKEYFFEKNESTKNNLKEKLFKETIPFLYARLEAMVKNNGGYLAGGKLTWGDLYFTAIHELFDHDAGCEITKDYPHLAMLRQKVVNIPSIKTWIEKRPETIR